MPIVRIELWEGRTIEQKEMLITEVSEAVSSALKIPPEEVFVLLYDVPKSHWGIAGVPASKKKK